MAAASCARRSGVRLSFLFTFLAVIGLLVATARIRGSGVKRRFFFSARPEVCTLLRALSARTADFLTKILRLHMGSTLLPPVADTTSAGYRVNDKNLLMSRHITAPSRSAYTGSVARK